MSDIPDAANLLATARALLLGDLLPALPDDLRYAALMVANAMAIAAREHARGAEALREEASGLRELLTPPGSRVVSTPSHPAVPAAATPAARAASDAEGRARAVPSAADGDVAALRRRLAAAIRAGAFDAPAQQAALIAHLARCSADRTAISNPKALRDSR
jgi:hypothetical protein